MKRKKMNRLTFIVLILLLAGCARQQEAKEKREQLSIIKNASQNTANLENGTYTYTSSQDIENELSKIDSEGVFVNFGNEVMWHTQTVLGQAENEIRTLTEDFQRSGVLYQRFGLVNEKNEYLEELLTPKWEIITEGGNRSPLYLAELIEVDILAEHIESIELSNEDELKVYEFTYTKDYRDSVMEERNEELEKALENQMSENADELYVSSLKQSINKQQNTEYTNKKVLMKVNEKNILVYVFTEDSYEFPVNDTIQSGTATTETIIGEYNDSTIGIDIDI